MDHQDNQRKVIITFIAVVIIAAVVVGAVAAAPKKQAASTATNVVTSAGTTSASSGKNTSSTTYKDGSYTATGSYESPDGDEQITVSITLHNGVITDTSATAGAHDPDGAAYQAQFISGYKSLVVGKNISSVSLSRVSGSSLTPQGFNDAISQIENQAKA